MLKSVHTIVMLNFAASSTFVPFELDFQKYSFDNYTFRRQKSQLRGSLPRQRLAVAIPIRFLTMNNLPRRAQWNIHHPGQNRLMEVFGRNPMVDLNGLTRRRKC